MLDRVVAVYHKCVPSPCDHVVNLLQTLRLFDLEDNFSVSR